MQPGHQPHLVKYARSTQYFFFDTERFFQLTHTLTMSRWLKEGR